MQTIKESVLKSDEETGGLRDESLPFAVTLVQDETDLDKALRIRHSAYGRHVPELADTLDKPEHYDHEPGVVVLLAQSKLDGEPLGTMRIQTNQYGPLALEQSVTLPDWLQGRRLAEATRLGIARGRIGRMVKIAMFKGYYLYCRQNDVDWMVITGRAPLDRQYDALQFQDVFPDRGFIPMRHVGDIPHRVMALEVASVEPGWRAAGHPLYDFFFRTRHDDIRVSTDPLTELESEAEALSLATGQRTLSN
ncbi:hypothetical protein PC39_13977 [Salinisphaera sp. PC39]|uniref:N-acyl amino acid synthase FeeM domain-containing protein n=1 Tax=Salinisphaera sp. PC39 TaxID=1304156 RepID=UPI003340DBFC